MRVSDVFTSGFTTGDRDYDRHERHDDHEGRHNKHHRGHWGWRNRRRYWCWDD